ncbi:MAG: hypothetical protein J3R72DRAFT_180210 [Linnemannia gamsii]|nr:MAG: hypothetical protein J3R72DRAFT_180210 [Linnemannia gamsii]
MYNDVTLFFLLLSAHPFSLFGTKESCQRYGFRRCLRLFIFLVIEHRRTKKNDKRIKGHPLYLQDNEKELNLTDSNQPKLLFCFVCIRMCVHGMNFGVHKRKIKGTKKQREGRIGVEGLARKDMTE